MKPSRLARWDIEIGDGERGVLADAVADFLAQPRLSDAIRHTVECALEVCDNDTDAHANFRDVGRMLLGTIALYLDATGGLTHTRLREISGVAGTLSAGRATAILLHLRMIGYVTAQSKRADGSARLYVPTKRMKDIFRRRLRIEFESLAMIEPETEELLTRLDEDEAFRLLIANFGVLIGRGGNRPEIELKHYDAITAKSSGTIIMFNLFHAADQGLQFPSPGIARVQISQMARRFRVSRAHVLRVLREAEEAGFITRRVDGEGVVIHPLLCDTFRLYYAIVHIILGAVAHRTLTTLRNQDLPRAAQ